MVCGGWESDHQIGIKDSLVGPVASLLALLPSEGDAGGEHSLYERRGGHQVLQLEIKDSLESLHTQRPQLGQFVQDPTEVVRLSLGVGIVGDVVSQRIYNFRL